MTRHRLLAAIRVSYSLFDKPFPALGKGLNVYKTKMPRSSDFKETLYLFEIKYLEERMKTTYLIWKDPSCAGINPEWQELTGQEFYALVKSPDV